MLQRGRQGTGRARPVLRVGCRADAAAALGDPFSFGLSPPAQPNHTPDGARSLSLDAGGNGTNFTGTDLEGTPAWYSFVTSIPSTSETITVSRLAPPDDPDNLFSPQFLDAVVNVYDPAHHLLALSHR